MDCGLLLPHFGERLTDRDVVGSARDAEAAGFDSVWVRDHIFLRGSGEGAAGPPCYDSMTVVAAVAATTSTVRIGTAALIPLRPAVQMAQISATLVNMFGPRFVWGVGSGNNEREFESIGRGGQDRAALVLSSMAAMRELWRSKDVTWHDGLVDFDHVTLNPRPVEPVPFWYCANNPKSARLAATVCDGWMPGRVNLPTLVERVRTIEKMTSENGRQRPVIGVVPATTVARTREAALDRIAIGPLLDVANRMRFWVKPPSGTFESVDDLPGMLLHGTPDDIVEQCADLRTAGVDHVVFDLRLAFADWDAQVEMLAADVVPRVAAL